MNTYRDISVIIPVYNGALTLKRTLESVLSQTLKPQEIIIVNDASTDATTAIVESYKEKIRLISHKTNLGAAAARNTGIQKAKGTYIAFLDADDTWQPNKLEIHSLHMKESNSDVSFSSFKIHRNNTTCTYRLKIPKNWKTFVLEGCTVSPGSTLLVKKTVFDNNHLFPSSLPRFEDWAWLIGTVYQGKKISMCTQILSDVYTTGFPSLNTVQESLQSLKNYIKTKNILKSTQEKRILQASFYLELAAAYHREKQWKNLFLYYGRAVFINPKLIKRCMPALRKIFQTFVDVGKKKA